MLPGPRGWFPLLFGAVSILCFPFWVGGLTLMLGQLTLWALGYDLEQTKQYVPRVATLYVAIGVTITLLQSYNFLEKAEMVIVGLLLVCLAIAAIASRPDWLAAAVGAVVPRVPAYPDWVVEKYADGIAGRPPWVEMMAILGAVGGGSYDYVGYVGMLRDKAWGMLGREGVALPEGPGEKIALGESPEEVKKARTWLRAPLIDCSVSFACVMIFSALFLILGARILHDQQRIPDGLQLLSHQSEFLTRIHPSLLYVYELGVFMAFFGTICVATYEVYVRTTVECLRGISPGLRDVSLRKTRFVVVGYCAIIGLILLWTMEKPVEIVTWPALFGGVFACGLWCFAMLWSEWRFLPKSYRLGIVGRAAVMIAGLALTVMGFVGILKQLGRF
jgi:Mn2+/Fe2+ NRAMP family transporter